MNHSITSHRILKVVLLLSLVAVASVRAKGESAEETLKRLSRMNAHGSVQECPVTVKDSDFDNEPAKLSCDFMKRSPPPRGQKENWGLDLTGADLMREHPLVLNAKTLNSYSSHQVAVVDTGLRARNNPSAGKKLQSESPETEYDQHGTHVAGIVASKDFGVNPSLSLKAYPVKYSGGGLFSQEGFDEADLVNQFQEALDNPKVSVINLSLSANEDPHMMGMIEEATKKGKWIVYAAGNEHSASSSSAGGLRELQNKASIAKSVFSIGALSSLGAPAAYSNFGSGVDYYAPGSAIDSLSSKYNVNLVNQDQKIRFSGTSMAAPHFTAILATMKAAAPALNVEDARKILDLTSISLGKKPAIKQVNAYGALELLNQSLKCMVGSKKAMLACIEQAQAATASQCKKTSFVKTPTTCKDAKLAYENARKKFFVCSGSEPSRQELLGLVDLLTPPSGLERLAYQSPDKYMTELAQQNALRGTLSNQENKEFNAAVDFYSGKFESLNVSDQGKQVVRADFKGNPSESLKRLELKPENAELFYEACAYVFANGATDTFSCGVKCTETCEDRLRDSSTSFKSIIVKKALAQGVGIGAEILFAAERLELPEADMQKVYQKYFLSTYPIEPESMAQSMLLNRLDSMNPETRKLILERFKDSKALGLTAKTWLLTNEQLHADPALEVEMKKNYAVENRDPLVADLRFESARLRAGQEAPEQFAGTLKKLLDKVTAYPTEKSNANGAFVEYGDFRFNTFALTKAMSDSPAVKSQIVKVLSEPGNLQKLDVVGDFPVMMQELSKNLNAADSKKLFNALVAHYGDPKRKESWSAGTLYSLVEFLSKDNLFMKAELNQLLAKKQSDPTLQKARIEYLSRVTHDSKKVDNNVRALVAEDPKGFAHSSLSLSPKVIFSDPVLKSRWIESKKSSSVLGWASNADTQDFKEASQVINPNFAKLLKASEFLNDHDVKNYVAKTILDYGNDPSVVKPLIGQLEILAKDKSFMEAGVFEATRVKEKYDESRGRSVIEAVQLIGMSKAGDRELAQHPELLKGVVEFATDDENRHMDGFSFEYPIPTAVFPFLKQKMNATEFDPEINLPSWVDLSIIGSKECLDASYQIVDKHPNERMVSNVSNAVEKGLIAHPEWATPERIQMLEKIDPASADKVRQALKEGGE